MHERVEQATSPSPRRTLRTLVFFVGCVTTTIQRLSSLFPENNLELIRVFFRL